MGGMGAVRAWVAWGGMDGRHGRHDVMVPGLHGYRYGVSQKHNSNSKGALMKREFTVVIEKGDDGYFLLMFRNFVLVRRRRRRWTN